MSTIVTRIAGIVAGSAVAAGITGAAVLGLAAPANAAEAAPQPGIVATPQVKASPAPNAMPGSWWHRHHTSLLDPTTAADFVAPGT